MGKLEAFISGMGLAVSIKNVQVTGLSLDNAIILKKAESGSTKKKPRTARHCELKINSHVAISYAAGYEIYLNTDSISEPIDPDSTFFESEGIENYLIDCEFTVNPCPTVGELVIIKPTSDAGTAHIMSVFDEHSITKDDDTGAYKLRSTLLAQEFISSLKSAIGGQAVGYDLLLDGEFGSKFQDQTRTQAIKLLGSL